MTDFVTVPLRIDLAETLVWYQDIDMREVSVEILKGVVDIVGYELYILLFGHHQVMKLTEEEFVTDLECIVQAVEAKEPGCRVMVSTLVPSNFHNNWNTQAYYKSKAIKAWAKEEGVLCADMFRRMARKDHRGLVPASFIDESELVLTKKGFTKAAAFVL